LTLRDGRRLAYAEWGDPDGRPVLFFHGTPSGRLLHPPEPEAFEGLRTAGSPSIAPATAGPIRSLFAICSAGRATSSSSSIS
jgi:pimeloyl-ACP methyl ester carboxylesterase